MITTIAHTGYFAARRLRNIARQPSFVVIALLEPFFWLLVLGGVYQQVVELPAFAGSTVDSYRDYLLPGIIVMIALINGAWAGDNLLIDMERGILDRLTVSPAKRNALIVGPLAQQAVVVVVQGVFVLALVALLGSRLSGEVTGIAVLFGSAILVCTGFGALSNALALFVRSHATFTAAVNLVTLPATFLSTAFMPAAAVAPWVAAASQASPVTWGVSTARAGLATSVNWADIGFGMLKLSVFAVLSVVVGLCAFHRYLRTT